MRQLQLVDAMEGEQWIYIDVIEQRSMSMAIAESLDVRHESPQLIMLKDGNVNAHGSHHQLTPDTVENWRK